MNAGIDVRGSASVRAVAASDGSAAPSVDAHDGEDACHAATPLDVHARSIGGSRAGSSTDAHHARPDEGETFPTSPGEPSRRGASAYLAALAERVEGELAGGLDAGRVANPIGGEIACSGDVCSRTSPTRERVPSCAVELAGREDGRKDSSGGLP